LKLPASSSLKRTEPVKACDFANHDAQDEASVGRRFRSPPPEHPRSEPSGRGVASLAIGKRPRVTRYCKMDQQLPPAQRKLFLRVALGGQYRQYGQPRLPRPTKTSSNSGAWFEATVMMRRY
jgi:hypothetical protein